jgi:hypothetical protein
MIYVGSNLTDLQAGQTASEKIAAEQAMARERAANQLAVQRILTQLEQQRLAQQGQYQQGQLGVQNKRVDADSAMAAAQLLFERNKHSDDVMLSQDRNRLFDKEISVKYPGEAQRVGEQRLKNEQQERDAMRLIEEHNNAATAAASRFNTQLQSRINSTKLALTDAQKARGDEWFTLDSTAKKEFDAKRAALESAGFPAETSAVMDAIGKDPDASKVIFDGKQFVPKLMRFTPTVATPAPTTATSGVSGVQQLFGGQTSTATAPAPVAATVVQPPAGQLWEPGMTYDRAPMVAPDRVVNANGNVPIIFSKPAVGIASPPTEDNLARARARFRQLVNQGVSNSAAAATIDREFPGVY